MALSSSNGGVNITQPAMPIFNGGNYEFWNIKIRTLFRSQDLWELVEHDYSEKEEEAKVKENRKRDSKALFFIQQAVHESVFLKIAAASIAREAWTTLQPAFHGSSMVVTVKLQTFTREFQNLQMKNGESVQEFLTKVAGLVNQMGSFGEHISEKMVVTKVLRSLPPKFDHVVAAIEESKDLSVYTFDELMGSLQSHEARINRNEEKAEEKALQVKGDGAKELGKFTGRGKGRGGPRGRYSTHGRGGGRGIENKFSKTNIQCHNYKKYGHMKAECWYREKQANFVEENQEENSTLFMAYVDSHGD